MNDTPTNTKLALRFAPTHDWGGGYGHIKFEFVWFDPDQPEDLQGQPASDNRFLNELEINCQYSLSDLCRDQPDFHTYAWEVAYRPYSVNLDVARWMTKTLSAIQAKLDAFEREWGHPVDYGQFALRVAKAAKVSCVISWASDLWQYNIWKSTDIPWLVENELARVRECKDGTR